MTLTDEQIAQLNAPLDTKRIAKRKQANITLDYLEGYDVIDTANRIFGYDGWSYRIDTIRDVTPVDGRPIFEAQVTVYLTGTDCYREDVGHGIAAGTSSEAIETARKGAVTDALKRALRSFGNQFGNSLYDKDHDRGATVGVVGRPTLRQADSPTASTPPAPRPAAPPRQAPPLPASAEQIKTIGSLLHQLDDVNPLAVADICEWYHIDIEMDMKGAHFSKGLAAAGLTGGQYGTASRLIDLLLPLVKKEAKGIPDNAPRTAGVGASRSEGDSRLAGHALPPAEDIKTAGDLFGECWRHFKLQRAEVLDILGVETQGKIVDFGAAWKIVEAKQGAAV